MRHPKRPGGTKVSDHWDKTIGTGPTSGASHDGRPGRGLGPGEGLRRNEKAHQQEKRRDRGDGEDPEAAAAASTGYRVALRTGGVHGHLPTNRTIPTV